MDIETFRKRFVHHSDEELILMLTKNASKYNPDALIVAKEILIDRNVDIETILKNENDLNEEEIEKRYKENIQSLRAKFNRSILVGLVMLIAALIFPIKIYSEIILYVVALFGITLIITGISGRIKVRRTSEIFLEPYNSKIIQ